MSYTGKYIPGFIDDGKLEFAYATEMLKIGLTKCKELGIKDW